MSWEVAAVVTVYAVPLGTIYMANKQLDPEVNEHFWWIRLLVFFFNLALIGLGLWVAQVIALANNATVGSLMQTAWKGYIWIMSFVVLIMVILLGWQLAKALFEKFPSLSERR